MISSRFCSGSASACRHSSCFRCPAWRSSRLWRMYIVNEAKLLVGPRVRLAPSQEIDLPTVTRWYGDAEFLRLFDAAPAYPRAESALRQWLGHRHRAQNGFSFGGRLPEE